MAIILAKVLVPKNKLGDFVIDLARAAPYSKLNGIEVFIPDAPREPQPQEVHALTYQSDDKLTKPQEKVMQAIQAGASKEAEISEASGVVRIKRVLNLLKRKKLVKVSNGTYTVAG